jgi:hypothetical protein
MLKGQFTQHLDDLLVLMGTVSFKGFTPIPNRIAYICHKSVILCGGYTAREPILLSRKGTWRRQMLLESI